MDCNGHCKNDNKSHKYWRHLQQARQLLERGPLYQMRDLLLAPSPLPAHAVFSCWDSPPLPHFSLTASGPPSHGHYPNDKPGASRCQIPGHRLLATPSSASTAPPHWLSSQMSGTPPPSPPFEGLLLQKATECCFPRFLPSSSLFMLHTLCQLHPLWSLSHLQRSGLWVNSRLHIQVATGHPSERSH